MVRIRSTITPVHAWSIRAVIFESRIIWVIAALGLQGLDVAGFTSHDRITRHARDPAGNVTVNGSATSGCDIGTRLGARPSNGERAPSRRATRARIRQIIGVFAGEAGLLGACSCFSDTLPAGGLSGVTDSTENAGSRSRTAGATYAAQKAARAAEPRHGTERGSTQYESVMAYLERADLLRFVQGGMTPHGSGSSFYVTFRFVTDDQSKADVLAILRNTNMFDRGPLGPGHVKDVGASHRADVYDFRSVNGALGPRSLEVMINHKSFWGYADVDRYNLYGGLAPATAHIFIELLPHKVWAWF